MGCRRLYISSLKLIICILFREMSGGILFFRICFVILLNFIWITFGLIVYILGKREVVYGLIRIDGGLGRVRLYCCYF